MWPPGPGLSGSPTAGPDLCIVIPPAQPTRSPGRGTRTGIGNGASGRATRATVPRPAVTTSEAGAGRGDARIPGSGRAAYSLGAVLDTGGGLTCGVRSPGSARPKPPDMSNTAVKIALPGGHPEGATPP